MKAKRLSEMKPREKGVIGHIECPDAAMALVEMGCCPGEEMTVAHVAPGDGPWPYSRRPQSGPPSASGRYVVDGAEVVA